uniref:Ubiquitin-like protease family profile domain-containing protein n=1 Tax=Ditylenchus dipsaci TaxID=166011 RepID=A0A915D5U9_9BILA
MKEFGWSNDDVVELLQKIKNKKVKLKDVAAYFIAQEFLQVESAQKSYKGLHPTNWLAFMDKTIAMQENSYDCGLFLCRFAKIASRPSQVNCAQKNMNRFCKQMALEVAAGALKKY